MRRKSTEKFMRDAMSFKAPEEVWDKIKDKPIQSVRESKAKGHPKKVWYAAAACIAACTVLISVLAVGKSLGLPASDSTLNTENGTERGGQIATDRAGEPEKKVPGETVSQTAEKTTAAVSHGGSVAGVCIPTYKVWTLRVCGRQPRADGFRFRSAAPRKNKRHGNRRLFAEKYPHGTEHRGQEKRYCPAL